MFTGGPVNVPQLLLGTLLGGIFGIVLASLSARARTAFTRQNARRIWRQSHPRISVILSTSGRINEKFYDIPVTGVGPARALGLLAPMLYKIYMKDGENSVLLSEHCDDKDKEGDLLLLGGPKNNKVTMEALTRMASKLPLTMCTDEDDQIVRTTSAVDHKVVAPLETEAGRPAANSVDYGLIIQTTNCFDPTGTITIIAGTHTYGTAAAARYLMENQAQVRKLNDKSYAMVVVARVASKDYVERPELYMGPIEF